MTGTQSPATSLPSSDNGAGAEQASEVMPGAMPRVLRTLLALLANVTIITALLVYFGWRRSETQARRLGIDESILGMSTRDYLLRSVGPVLALLVGVAVAGLVGAAVDRRVAPWVRRSGSVERPSAVAFVLGVLSAGWLILPAMAFLAGLVWRTPAFVLFPASIGVGIVTMLYAAHLRRPESVDSDEQRRSALRLASGGLLIGVCLFWTASNYAQVLGAGLADDLVAQVSSLPAVAVYSEQRLHLEGPGVTEADLGGGTGDVRFRYAGLRFLEHTGGRYFLLSDRWTPASGAVVVLPDDDRTVRLDFVGHPAG
jgi:hypothetical protein